MEELLNNFAKHLMTRVSPKVGSQVENYVNKVFSESFQDDSDVIEHEVKTILSRYFKNADGNEYFKIAENLYNSYIEEDDRNLINAVKVFVRVYSHYEDMKVKKVFNKWRINSLYTSSNNTISKEEKIVNYPNYENYENQPSYDKPLQLNKKLDVFNKLYLDAFVKNDEKLLNDEIKRVSEMNQCTFRPNSKKK